MTNDHHVPRIARRLTSLASAIRAKLERSTFRISLLLVAALLFIAGAWYSFHEIAISPGQLQVIPLVMLALLTLPSLLYGGIGLALLARSSKLSIPVGKATVISAYAYLAELLPLPGGAIVRTGALMRAGGQLKRSSALVILTAVLWIALAIIGTGFALLPMNLRLSLPLLLIGSLATIVISAWLLRIAGLTLTLQTLSHRIAGILLAGVRLQFAFKALNVTTGLTDTLPFVLASLIGSASSIAPAGLGISESLAAIAATTTAFSPGTAFLAVGIDRLFCVSACVALVLWVRTGKYIKGKLHAKPGSIGSTSN